MDKKTTIKTLRDIIRVLKDDDLFLSSDYEQVPLSEGNCIYSRVQQYIMKKLEL